MLVLQVPSDDIDFIKEAMEAALEESREVLSRHAEDDVPGSDEKSTSEGAEDFIRVYETQKERIQALERVYEQLRR